MSEQDLVKPILDAIRASGLAHMFRVQSGMVKVRGAWMRLCPSGTADLLGWLLDGTARTAGIELKKLGKKPTAIQVEWRKALLAAGGVAGVATSPEEALAILRTATKPRAA